MLNAQPGRRDDAEGVLACVAAFLGLEPSAAQLAAAARVHANRGHDSRSAVAGCGSRQHLKTGIMRGACNTVRLRGVHRTQCSPQLGVA